MRVLVLSQYYWPESFRITEVVQALQDEGCEMLVLTGQPNYPDGDVFEGYSAWRAKRQFHEGIPILRVPLAPRGRGSALQLMFNYLSFVLSATFIGTWLLRGRSIDAILVFAPSPILQAIPAIWLARWKKTILITWVQDLWPESLSATGFVRNKALLGLVSRLVGWIYARNDMLLVQSEAFIEPVQALAGKTPVRYHPNPGDFAFSNTAAQEPCPLAYSPGFNVVFTGNLGFVQSLETIVDAAELLRDEKDVRLILVGSGSRDVWLKTEIERRRLDNILLPGRFPLADMPSIMAGASALLVSLVKTPIMSRTVPSKVQAYLAAGKPIIASLDGEGARIVTEASAGLACAAEDAVALAVAIRTLRESSSETLVSMGQSARAYYDMHFAPHLLAERLNAILMSCSKKES